MENLKKQVRRARRRMVFQQFLSAVGWALLITLSLAVLAVGAAKIWPLGVEPAVWAWSWLGGAAAGGVLGAGIWTLFVRRTGMDAAIEIDRRFGLKERVSSALALDERQLDSEAGRALSDDAARRVERIDVSERFGVAGSRLSLLPLIPAAVVFGLILFVPNPDRQSTGDAAAAPTAVTKQIKKSTENLQQRIAERRKKAEEKGLEDASDLFKKLEQGVGNIGNKDDVDRKKAMAKLNDLADELKERRKQLGSRDEMRKQLSSLKDLKTGPGDKMARAIKDGDFQKALDELKDLRKQLQDGSLNDQQRADLAEQMNQMSDKLKQLVDAHEQAKRDLEEEIKRKLESGDLAEAGKLQQKLDQLKRQDQKMNRLAQMANKLGQCSKCVNDGKASDALGELDKIAVDLEAMRQELDELEMLDGMMDEIAQAKDAMNCKHCGGVGCEMCMGMGFRESDFAGMGMGEGQGVGARPEKETDTDFYNSQVRGKLGRGKAVVVDTIPGRNVAGQTLEEIKASIESARAAGDDPLVGQRIPRPHREQAEQYFSAFNEGQ